MSDAITFDVLKPAEKWVIKVVCEDGGGYRDATPADLAAAGYVPSHAPATGGGEDKPVGYVTPGWCGLGNITSEPQGTCTDPVYGSPQPCPKCAEHRDRLVTIIDEEFGLQPVEPDTDALLTTLERLLFEARVKRQNELYPLGNTRRQSGGKCDQCEYNTPNHMRAGKCDGCGLVGYPNFKPMPSAPIGYIEDDAAELYGAAWVTRIYSHSAAGHTTPVWGVPMACPKCAELETQVDDAMAHLYQIGATRGNVDVRAKTAREMYDHSIKERVELEDKLDAARNELGLVVAASLLAEGETLVEPPGPRSAALAAMLNTVHRAHEAERTAPLCCECQRIATCIGSSEAGIQCLCDDCCGHGNEDSWCVPIADVAEWIRKREDQLGKELAELEQRAQSAELGCEIAYKREPAAEEGNVYEFEHHQSMGPVEKSGECHVPMGDWHGHRCTCGKWVWGGGTVCQGCIDAQAVRLAVVGRDAANARAEAAERSLSEAHNLLSREQATGKSLTDELEKINSAHADVCEQMAEARKALEAHQELVRSVESFEPTPSGHLWTALQALRSALPATPAKLLCDTCANSGDTACNEAQALRGIKLTCAAYEPSPAKTCEPDRDEIPQEVHDRGWQWRPVGDGAFAPPFGTIRACRHCGCLVAGGPTACARCVDAKPSPADGVGRPRVIVLSGSTSNRVAFRDWAARLVITEGAIVMPPTVWSKAKKCAGDKPLLDQLFAIHLAKIDMADDLFVLDMGGRIGDSTAKEIAYAEAHGKCVRYLSKEAPDWTVDSSEFWGYWDDDTDLGIQPSPAAEPACHNCTDTECEDVGDSAGGLCESYQAPSQPKAGSCAHLSARAMDHGGEWSWCPQCGAIGRLPSTSNKPVTYTLPVQPHPALAPDVQRVVEAAKNQERLSQGKCNDPKANADYLAATDRTEAAVRSLGTPHRSVRGWASPIVLSDRVCFQVRTSARKQDGDVEVIVSLVPPPSEPGKEST